MIVNGRMAFDGDGTLRVFAFLGLIECVRVIPCNEQPKLLKRWRVTPYRQYNYNHHANMRDITYESLPFHHLDSGYSGIIRIR